MLTNRKQKAPIPLLNNRSYKTAPSYSYYDLSHRQDPKIPLRETATHFIQALTPVIPKPLPGSLSRWFSPEGGLQQNRKMAGFRPEERSFPLSTFRPSYQRSVLSNQASRCWSSPLCTRGSSQAAWPSWGDLSEVVPHSSTLFQIRLTPFLPKQDQSELFNPGEKPFISHLVEANKGWFTSDNKYFKRIISTRIAHT